jgi:opacity protein-like surface antigen
MNPFGRLPKHPIDQDDLIAFHLRELSPRRERALRRILQTNPALALESAAIAATLLAFPKSEAALPIDAALLDRNWLALRSSLALHVPQPSASRFLSRKWALLTLATSAFAATALVLALHHHQQPITVATLEHSLSTVPARTPSANPITSLSSDIHPVNSTPHPPTINQASNPPFAFLRADNQAASAPNETPSPDTSPTALFPNAVTPPSLTPPSATTIPAATSTADAMADATALPLLAATRPSSIKGHNSSNLRHSHPADFTLAMFGNFPASNSSSSTSGTGTSAVTQTLSQTGTNAVGALASFHQQFSPWIGYRITTTYSRPTFAASSGTSTSSGNYSTGSFAIAQSIYELSGTYTVQGPRHGRLSTSVEAGASMLAFSSIDPYPIPPTNIHSFRSAAVAGIGAELALSKHWALHAEYRAQFYKPPAFYTNNTSPTSGNTTLSSNPIFGITYHFVSTDSF